jgi:branched-chain amino acid transport system permease protein
MGKNVGVIVAAFLLTLLPEGLREMSNWRFALPFIGREISLGWVKDTRMILYSFLIIVIMLARPQGLFAWPLRRKEPAPKP